MKINHFSWDTDYRFYRGQRRKLFSWGHKEKKLNKNYNIVFNWQTHVTKTFDVIKLKSQPKTPEIQRFSL